MSLPTVSESFLGLFGWIIIFSLWIIGGILCYNFLTGCQIFYIHGYWLVFVFDFLHYLTLFELHSEAIQLLGNIPVPAFMLCQWGLEQPIG